MLYTQIRYSAIAAFLFSGAKSKRLDAMEEVKQAATGVRLTAREIADKYGVKSEGNIAELE